eukprot:12664024-Alexandrium_andersonii.AAC.1
MSRTPPEHLRLDHLIRPPFQTGHRVPELPSSPSWRPSCSARGAPKGPGGPDRGASKKRALGRLGTYLN